MKKIYMCFFIPLFITLSISKVSYSQTWFRESFDVVQVPADTTPIGWSQKFVSGSHTEFPNGFKRYSTSSYPTVGPGGFSGAGFIKFNSRGANYPALSGSWCVAGDASLLSSPSLDWTGRTNISQGWISFRFWRSNSVTGGIHLVADSISVFLNTRPDLTGAIQLTESATASKVIPRSSVMAPNGVANSWNLLKYNLPAFGTYPQLDTSSNVYMIIKATSQGGDNMYLDSVNIPSYPTNMVLQGAQIHFQATQVNKNTTHNPILGVRFYAHGTLIPKTIDSMVFSPNGSTSPLTDITNVKLWFTGTNPVFSTATQYEITKTSANISFGYLAGNCPNPTINTPSVFQCKPGWNYYWLTYDIPATAMSGHTVDADFVGFNSGAQPCAAFQALNLTITGGAVISGSNYLVPTYTSGTSSLTDYISGIESLNGQNATTIDNWYHDATVGLPCVNYCDRFDSHPDDYTLFAPANSGTHKNRYVQLRTEQGVRSATPPFVMKVAPGTTLTNNCIAVFVDWNADGDFYDLYSGAPGPVISENYGTQCLSAGTPSNPFAIGNAYGIWTIDVPSKNDFVFNGPGIGAVNGGPLFIGNTRLRVREAYSVNSIEPNQSGYTWGETEDYTIAVFEDCPTASANVCKWLGITSDWNSPINWCPDVPTLNDLAYIPSQQSVYPVLTSGVKASCRTLKIVNGANMTIDCQQNGSLKVADSLIIGANSIASTSWLKINSAFNDTVTIPAATSIPPNGFGTNTFTPFKQNQNSKFQIAYTAVELTSAYGLSSGDVIDQLTFLLKTTPASIATYPVVGGGFRIIAYLIATPVVYPQPLPNGVSVATKTGNPGIVSSMTIYTGSFTISPGQSSLTLSLIPNSFVYDGVSNLVLSFEYFGGSANVGVSQLYCELGPSYQTLYLTCNTAATLPSQPQSGYSIDGANSSNGVYYSQVTGASALYRPRIDFGFHKIYNPFPITIGKAFVNNNNSGSPVGANGFVAGNSRVTFDPTIRSTVISVGLFLFSGSIYNPSSQSVALSADTMCVTSGINPLANGSYTSGVSSTVFNSLEVKGNTTGAASIVKQHKSAYSDSLILTTGELRLNQNLFTLKKGKPAALKQTNGWIRSESPGGGNSSAFKWNIGSTHNTFIIPFGISSTSIFKFVYTGISGSIGNLTVSTYGTPASNLPLPTGVTNINDTNGVNNSLYTVDRFWKTNATSTTANGIYKFNYRNNEAAAPIANGNVRAQRWNTNSGKWIINSFAQSNVVGAGISSVTINGLTGSNLNGNWAFADQTHPLRITVDEGNEMTAYPVPFNDIVTLNIQTNEKTFIRIYDFTGRMIEETSTTKSTIQLGNQWPKGIYLITVQQEKSVKKLTVVKN